MKKRPEGRVVFVTGAAMGNGWAIASRFLSMGDLVVATDINGDALDKTRGEFWQSYGDERLLCLTADVADAEEVSEAVDDAISYFGRLDILVNNAGITGGPDAGIVHETPVDEFDRVLAVNLRGVFLCCHAALPHMLRQGSGVIVNIASVAGMVAFPGRAAYSVSKGAVVQLTKSIATDYAGRGIRCNALCPGFIETPMTKWRLDQPELKEALLARIPQNEIGTVDQIASAVSFLASEEAHYFNGASVVMDGGYMAF
jgi:NAD(P)-dependent dehydrogenase (short-subunit alcohol dehydrogenase family)